MYPIYGCVCFGLKKNRVLFKKSRDKPIFIRNLLINNNLIITLIQQHPRHDLSSTPVDPIYIKHLTFFIHCINDVFSLFFYTRYINYSMNLKS